MADWEWTRFGRITFRPHGGRPYLEQLCGRLLARWLDRGEVRQENADFTSFGTSTFATGTGIVASDQHPDAASSLSLLLKEGRVAGLWVRFGADYAAAEEGAEAAEPTITEAFLAACRARDWSSEGRRTTAEGSRWELLLVLEWPAALISRARPEVHDLVLGDPALPRGGSGLAALRGTLDKGGLVESVKLSPISLGQVGALLDGKAEPRDDGYGTDDEEEEPTQPDQTDHAAAAAAPSGSAPRFGDGEDADASTTGAEVKVRRRKPEPAKGRKAPEWAVGWGTWLGLLAGAERGAPGGGEGNVLVRCGLFPQDPSGRFLDGYLTPSLGLAAWGAARDLGARSNVKEGVRRAFSGLASSLLLVAAGLGLVAAAEALRASEPEDRPRAEEPEPIPTISFCSMDNRAFADALGCWTERLSSGGGLGEDRCDNEVDRDLIDTGELDLRALWCGISDRSSGDMTLGDQALANACFQVLAEPDLYRSEAGEFTADAGKFLSSESGLLVPSLAELRNELRSECETCESEARGRIRSRNTLSWIGSRLRDAVGARVPSEDEAELGVCSESGGSPWRELVPDERFDYEAYFAARYPMPYADGSAWDPEWLCYRAVAHERRPPEEFEGEDNRRLSTTLGFGLSAPARWDVLGGGGVRGQLGLHALLWEDEPAGSSDGYGACAGLARQELGSLASAHPLYFEPEEDDELFSVPTNLCGQVCAGFFGVGRGDVADWRTPGEDLALCIGGTNGGAELLGFDDRLPNPRLGEVEEGDGIALASQRGGVEGILFDTETSRREPLFELPSSVRSCGMQLIVQDLSAESAEVPGLLPPGEEAQSYEMTALGVARDLYDWHGGEVRERWSCEELGAFCFTTAALMVKRPSVVWRNAPEMATRDTARDFAFTLGPSLQTFWRRDCTPPASWDESRTWEPRQGNRAICEAVRDSGVLRFRTRAAGAGRETRVDSAFRLATRARICTGLQAMLSDDDRDARDLTWEEGCFQGLRARRRSALALMGEAE